VVGVNSICDPVSLVDPVVADSVVPAFALESFEVVVLKTDPDVVVRVGVKGRLEAELLSSVLEGLEEGNVPKNVVEEALIV
jgi:hypothetical protein